MAFKAVVTEMAVHHIGDNPIYCDSVIRIRLDDEAGGIFVVLSQVGADIRVDMDELELITTTAKKMIDDAEGKNG